MPAQNTPAARVPSGAGSNFHAIGFRGGVCVNAASALWGRGNERGCESGFILWSREGPENGSQGVFGQVGNFQHEAGRSLSVRRASPCCSSPRRLSACRFSAWAEVAPREAYWNAVVTVSWAALPLGSTSWTGCPDSAAREYTTRLPRLAGHSRPSRAAIGSAASASEAGQGRFSVFSARLPKTEVHICRLRDDLNQVKGKHRGEMGRFRHVQQDER